MPRAVIQTTAFRRDLKRARKRGLDLDALYRVVECLALDHALQAKHRPHPLEGDWKPKWECHIAPDWLLIYEINKTDILLVRTGTHADLFE